ncbi:MAG: hypothetical protein KGI54_15390 [Pseudomonadota bacterium]|nr:hypothetical protein [Pseudomonadota bacterium]
MSNLYDFAKKELTAAGLLEKDSDHGGMLAEAVLQLIDTFDNQEHSGFSAPTVVSIFKQLAMFEPLSPLTGDDEEWVDHGNGLCQNNRCPHVFKDQKINNGKAYNIEGRIFKTPSGECYINSESRVFIDFPYTPAREYVEVDE